jgi:lysozyme family protein
VFAASDIAVTIADTLGVETAMVLGSVYSVANRRLRNQVRQLGAHTPGTVRDSSPSLVAEPAPVEGPLQQALMPFMEKGASGRLRAMLASRLRIARNKTHTHPTPAQAHAGNYAKGSLLLHGMHIKIENPKGTERRGYDKDGNISWTRVMKSDYGYFAGTKAVDGDAVDVFIGDDLDSHFVAAVDQMKSDGSFDETKFVIGTTSQEQAEKLYLAHYPRGWKLGPVSTTTVQQLKDWLKEGDTKSPFKGQMVKAAGAYEDGSASRTLNTLLSSLGGAMGGSLIGTAIGERVSGKQLAAMQKVNLREQRISTKYDALLNATSGPSGRNRNAELLVHAGPAMQKVKRLRGKNSKLYGDLVDVVRRKKVIGGRTGGGAGLALGAVAPFVIEDMTSAARRLKTWLKGQLVKAAGAMPDDIYSRLLQHEGGTRKVTVDTGGTTKGGISAKGTGLTPAQIKALSAGDIRERWDGFWDQSGKHFKDPRLAEIAVNYAGNAGPGTFARHLQQTLNKLDTSGKPLAVDGVLGGATTARINAMDPGLLGSSMMDRFHDHHEGLVARNPAKYQPYQKGWASRRESLRGLLDQPTAQAAAPRPVWVRGSLTGKGVAYPVNPTRPVMVRGNPGGQGTVFYDFPSVQKSSSLHAHFRTKSAVVKQDEETGKWILWTKDETRKLGTHDTPGEAYKQEYAIQKSQESKRSTSASSHKKLKAALNQTEKAATVMLGNYDRRDFVNRLVAKTIFT